MKRYFTFYGNVYYPKQGMGDFIGDYDTILRAKLAAREQHEKRRPTGSTWEDADWEFSYSVIWDSYDRRVIHRKGREA